MSDTPRTDAHTRQLIDILQHPHWIEFARSLEREAVSLRDDLDALQHTLRGMEVQEERLRLENAELLKRLEASDEWDDYNSIKTLQRENAALKQQCETCETAAVIDSYVRENAALRADKERLDWLSSEEGNEWASRYFDTILEIPPMNRQSIDAARKKQP